MEPHLLTLITLVSIEVIGTERIIINKIIKRYSAAKRNVT